MMNNDDDDDVDDYSLLLLLLLMTVVEITINCCLFITVEYIMYLYVMCLELIDYLLPSK